MAADRSAMKAVRADATMPLAMLTSSVETSLGSVSSPTSPTSVVATRPTISAVT